MRITALPYRELDEAQLSAWSRVVDAPGLLDSPFLRPEFARAVASVRDDVEVAVLEDGGEPVGFLPFQRGRRNVARPVGCGLNEFQSAVSRPDAQWTLSELLHACRLTGWHYDHLLLSDNRFGSHHSRVGDSAFMDLSRGFEAYCREHRASGSLFLKKMGQKARKLEREIGPIEFEMHTPDARVFRCLIDWKRAQHRRTGVVDVFEIPWVTGLMIAVRETRSAGLTGVLSVLRAGGTPVAVHLGMRTPTVAHAWYPTYDVRFGKYSPGTILFLRLAERLAELGIRRFDFGPGSEHYKRHLAPGAMPVAMGTVYRWPGVSRLSCWLERSRGTLRESRFLAPVRRPLDYLSRFRQWLAWQ